MAKSLTLKNIPVDIQDAITTRQSQEKKSCECIRSQEWVVYKIIREYAELKKASEKIQQPGAGGKS